MSEDQVFQSPPHRGIRCDNEFGVTPVAQASIFQSPPHRGIRCDWPWYLTRRLVPTHFSPLLIGEFGVTLEVSAPAGADDLGFQSPPHRGIRCDVTSAPAGADTSR